MRSIIGWGGGEEGESTDALAGDGVFTVVGEGSTGMTDTCGCDTRFRKCTWIEWV